MLKKYVIIYFLVDWELFSITFINIPRMSVGYVGINFWSLTSFLFLILNSQTEWKNLLKKILKLNIANSGS